MNNIKSNSTGSLLSSQNSRPTAKSTTSLSLRGIFENLIAGFFESIVR